MSTQKIEMKTTITNAMIIALVSIVLQLIGMVAGLATENWYKWGTAPLIFVLYFILIKRTRDNELGGFMSYGQVLGQGTLMGLFSSIVVGLFLFVYLEYVDSAMIDQILQQSYDEYVEAGMSDSQIEQTMPYVEKFLTPTWMGVWSIIGGVVAAFVYSLIAGIFVKKEGTPFETIDE